MVKEITGGEYESFETLGKQTIHMEFWNTEPSRLEYRCKWKVSLVIYTKRKKINQHFNNCEISGESGIETFLIAARMLREFEEYIVDKYPHHEHIMYVDGADSLRRRIYQHFLPRYGYSKIMVDGRPIMAKNLVS